MLSRNVTCAIKLFHVLYHGERLDDGRHYVNEIALEKNCQTDHYIYREVFSKLFHNGHITIVDSDVILLKTFTSITLYELCNLFHGGIPVGEQYEYDYNGLDYLSIPKCPPIVHLEYDMKEFTQKRFKRVTMESLFKPIDDDIHIEPLFY